MPITFKAPERGRTQVGEISKLYRQGIEKDAGLSCTHLLTLWPHLAMQE